MPNTSAGTQAPPSAELLAEVGVDDAFDVAGAEFLRLLGEALRHGVGDPGGDVGAGAGQRADQDADAVAAQEIAASSA